jgi:hypothetical protein
MRVGNRLAGSLANIDTDVVAVRHAPRFDVTPNCRNRSPNAGLFLTGEGEEIGLVSPRNNQATSLIQRISVGKRHGEVVRSKVISASEPVTEDTIQFASPRCIQGRRPVFVKDKFGFRPSVYPLRACLLRLPPGGHR